MQGLRRYVVIEKIQTFAISSSGRSFGALRSLEMNQPHPLLSAVLISVCLSACVSDTNINRKPLKVPAAWKNAGNFPVAAPSKDLSRWWGRFEDPALNRLITAALQDSPDISAATARVRESRARRDSVFAGLFPVLDGGVSSNSRSTDTDPGGRISGTSYSASLDASWEVDLFGRRRGSRGHRGKYAFGPCRPRR